MVAHLSSAPPSTDQTIFEVLASRARSHTRRFLAFQALICAAAAAVLVLRADAWWPLSSLLLAVACYSSWGVLDSLRQDRGSRILRLTKHALVILAAVACLATAVGTAFALFVGDSASPYGTCYEPDGRAFACNSRGERR